MKDLLGKAAAPAQSWGNDAGKQAAGKRKDALSARRWRLERRAMGQ